MSEQSPGAGGRRGPGDDALLAGAWALDALDDDERAEYEARLGREPDERAAAAELRETAARLGGSTPVEPPGHLRRNVLASLGSVEQEAPLAPVSDLSVARRRRVAPRGDGRTKPSRWSLLVAAAAVVVAAAGVGVSLDARQDADRAQNQAAAERADAEHLSQMLNTPGARVVRVEATGGGSATVVRTSTSAAVVSTLPAVEDGSTYQVWLIGDGGVHSAGLLTDPTAPYFVPDAGTATAVGISVEPAGGSEQPTTDPVVVASFV